MLILLIAATVALSSSWVLADPPPEKATDDAPQEVTKDPNPPAKDETPKAEEKPKEHRRRPLRTDVKPLTKEQEAEFLTDLKDRFPDRHEQFMKLKESNPEHFHQALARMYQWQERWKHLPEEARQAAMADQDLKIQAMHLSRRCQNEKDPKRQEELKEELREVLLKRFESEQKLRETRLAAMQEQLKHLEQEIAERAENRDEIVDKQLTRMLARRPRTSTRDQRDDKRRQRDKNRDKPRPAKSDKSSTKETAESDEPSDKSVTKADDKSTD
jgi:hypothetical protein